MKNEKQFIVVLKTFTLLVFTASLSFAKGQTVSIQPDSTHIEIGDPLRFFLKVETNKKSVIDFPVFKGDSMARFEIISKEKIDTTTVGDKLIFSQYITASVYDSGTYVIAPFPVFFSNENNQLDSAFSNELILTVATLPIDTAQPIKAIKAPLQVPYMLREFYSWIVAGLGLVILLIIAFLLYKKYKKKPTAEPQKFRPAVPPHVWALGELKLLEEEKLWQKDEHKKYYSRLSEILRNYLEYRYEVDAMESTTDEIKFLIANQKIKREWQNRLLETLSLADFAKFAKMTPLPDQNSRSMENAKMFVEHTKLILESAEENNKSK